MITEKVNPDSELLRRLSIFLEKKNTFDNNFLKGIALGRISEYPFRQLISPPGTPESWSNEEKVFKWVIRMPPEYYLSRINNKDFNEDFNNDFDEIKHAIKILNKIPNKIIADVAVKPSITDETFLNVLGEIIKSRTIHYSNLQDYFNSDYLDGFSKGTWKINQVEVPTMPTFLPPDSQSNETIPVEIKNELFIEMPFENFQHKINVDFNNDDDYILKVANEIKHFSEDIYKVEVKPR